MQRISFDFMTRRLRQMVREGLSKRVQRRKQPTIEELDKKKKDAEFYRQFVPETRWGSRLLNRISKSDSRQSRRMKLRVAAFNEITKRYPGEPRRIRRSMAFDSVRNKVVA
jgi:hypothetical protein